MVQVIQKQQVLSMLIASFRGSDRMSSMLRSAHQKHLLTFFNYIYISVEQFGKIFISHKKTTLLLYFQKSKVRRNLRSATALLRLILFSISWENLRQTIRTNWTISQIRRKAAQSTGHHDYLYVWFLAGKETDEGYRGLREAMLHIKKISRETRLPVYIETAVPRMIPIYKRGGFEFYEKQSCGKQIIWFAKYISHE